MKNNFFNSPVANIYFKPSSNSEITSQILYGEKFNILSKKNNWLKIKTNYDNYIGYIKKKIFNKKFKATKKVYKLKSRIYILKNKKFEPTNNFLYFGSGILSVYHPLQRHLNGLISSYSLFSRRLVSVWIRSLLLCPVLWT